MVTDRLSLQNLSNNSPPTGAEPAEPWTTNITGELVFLGTGTSTGVPVLGCGCPVCRSQDPKNQRTRCGVLLGLPEGNLLIDTPPELRLQLLREGVGVVHAVAFTHAHADHLHGLDDLRIFSRYLGDAVPLYCEAEVERRIRESFAYCFAPRHRPHTLGAIPQLEFRNINLEAFSALGQTLVPLRLKHGPWDVLGFRVGNVAYCTDTNLIPEETWPRLAGLDVFILDCLRAEPHPTHFHLTDALAVAQKVNAPRTILTHLSCRLDYQTTSDSLPDGVELAYDGLRIPLT